MNVLITEEQLRKIIMSEQRPDNLMPFQPDNPAYTGKAGGASEITPNDLMTGAKNAQKDRIENGDIHLFINTLMIPGGVYADALMGLFLGATEYVKGNKKTAAAVSLLSLLPYYSKIKNAIPAIGKLTKEGIDVLATKITGVNKVPLTSAEKEVVNGMMYHKQDLQQLVTYVNNALSNTAKYKNQYVRTFGQQKFQELFSKLVNRQITKSQYVDELVNGLKNTYEKVNWKTIAGIKFIPEEEKAIIEMAKKIQAGKKFDIFSFKLNIEGVMKDVRVQLGEFPPSSFDMGASYKKDLILVNLNNVRNFSLEKIINTLSHEAAHIKDLSYRSQKMINNYSLILKKIDDAEKMVNELTVIHGADSPEVLKAKKMYADYYTKYTYHYQEMLANNSKVMQSLTRNIKNVIGQYGVPETQKMMNSMRYGLRKGIPDNINFYLDKFMGLENAKYVKQIRTFDKNLYKDLMKQLSKQLDYMEEQLKLYQQY